MTLKSAINFLKKKYKTIQKVVKKNKMKFQKKKKMQELCQKSDIK